MKLMSYFEKTFYEEIIPDAASGKIYTDKSYNIGFNTKIIDNNETIEYFGKEDQPTLMIKNKEEFDKKMQEYIKIIIRNRFDNDYENIDIKEKNIMSLLWANATVNDFNNPIPFIQRYINFNNDITFNDYLERKLIGHSDILNCDVEIEVRHEKVFFETPFALNIRLSDNYNGHDKVYLDLPLVRYGVSDGVGYIYAIQQSKRPMPTVDEYFDEANAKFQKRINRAMYKINDGFVETADSIDNIDNPENITGITASTLLSLTTIIALFDKHGITMIKAPDYLPVRSNEKDIHYQTNAMFVPYNEREAEKVKQMIIKDGIMRNVVDKFIRTFRRLEYHFDHINIDSLPYEYDDCLNISIGDDVNCNNLLLDQVYKLASSKQKSK